MTRRLLLAQIRKFGPTNLARALGVAPSTVRRWKAGASPKPDSVAKLESLSEGAKALPPAALLRLSAPALADYAGVTEKTAQGWKKAGKVPEGAAKKARLRSLVESRIGEPEKVPKSRGARLLYSGRLTRGTEFRLDFASPAHLGPLSLGVIIDWMRQIKLSKAPSESWLQVVIAAKSDTDFASVVTNNHYGTVVVSDPPTLKYHDHVFAGTTKRGPGMLKRAADEMKRILTDAMPYDFDIVSASVYQRRAL